MSPHALWLTKWCVSLYVFLAGALLFTLLCTPSLLLAQTSRVGSQVEALMATADEEDTLPLTAAQEQARQLARALIETQGASPTAEKRTLLGVIIDQAVRPGTRVIVPIFTLQGIVVRLVSGEQTFASPVEDDGATVVEDARRPLFLPASRTALALEILVE